MKPSDTCWHHLKRTGTLSAHQVNALFNVKVLKSSLKFYIPGLIGKTSYAPQKQVDLSEVISPNKFQKYSDVHVDCLPQRDDVFDQIVETRKYPTGFFNPHLGDSVKDIAKCELESMHQDDSILRFPSDLFKKPEDSMDITSAQYVHDLTE